jgi:hypothetical protein
MQDLARDESRLFQVEDGIEDFTMLEIYPDRVNPGSLWGAANITNRQA